MFGLTMRERLLKAICQVCIRNAEIYKFEVSKTLGKYGNNCPPDEEMESVTKKYFHSVRNDVFQAISQGSPSISYRIKLACKCPALCGYPDDEDELYMAGYVYAICFWAIKDKEASPSDCIAMNHIQAKIIDDTLHTIDDLID